jgi:uncharacterized protein (TIGR02145 family)
MKRILFLLILLCSFISVFAQDATVIYKNTVNSTVTIETYDGLGSGFFVAENIIATNYHVIKGDTEAYCYTNNSDTKYKIEGYVAVDTSVDLILLKVSGLKRTPIRISTTPVEIGQKVYVIGSPKGLPATISDGIVSALRDFDGYKLMQITAPISHGSSGGPVLNSKGELIGVSVASLKEGQNLNFAIPKAYLKSLLNSDLKTENSILLKYKIVRPLSSLNQDTDRIQDLSKLRIIGTITGDDFSIDQKTYSTVIIGTQEWTAENLNACTFRNGDLIPEAKTNEEWEEAGKEGKAAWCYYDNDPANGIKYGRLYNWYAVNDKRGLAPEGWHIATEDEWALLWNYLGGDTLAGEKMKNIRGWSMNGNGNNSSGFSALPGGNREQGKFTLSSEFGFFWSSTQASNTIAENTDETWAMEPNCNFSWYNELSCTDSKVHSAWCYSNKRCGYSVRCVKGK